LSGWSLANAAAWSVGSLLAARLLTGVGLGSMTVIAITYLSELMPSERRGRMQAAVLATGLLGIPVMAFLARGVVPLGEDSWRIVFGFGSLGFLALALISRLPESPRWLLEHRGCCSSSGSCRRSGSTASSPGSRSCWPTTASRSRSRSASPR
jgi:putative MFS transporter